MNVEGGNQNKMDTPDVIEMESEDKDVMEGVPDYDRDRVWLRLSTPPLQSDKRGQVA